MVDSELFRALCEPARIEIVKLLTARGRSDVRTLTALVPQDQSVVSRHLAVLHRAGVVRRQKVGRQVFFEVDGLGIVNRMERMLAQFRAIIPLCCPPAGPPAARPQSEPKGESNEQRTGDTPGRGPRARASAVRRERA